jgi:hypothetical protein
MRIYILVLLGSLFGGMGGYFALSSIRSISDPDTLSFEIDTNGRPVREIFEIGQACVTNADGSRVMELIGKCYPDTRGLRCNFTTSRSVVETMTLEDGNIEVTVTH